jgi:hypothetical protein
MSITSLQFLLAHFIPFITCMHSQHPLQSSHTSTGKMECAGIVHEKRSACGLLVSTAHVSCIVSIHHDDCSSHPIHVESNT